jgi:hypothetical protein
MPVPLGLHGVLEQDQIDLGPGMCPKQGVCRDQGGLDPDQTVELPCFQGPENRPQPVGAFGMAGRRVVAQTGRVAD